LSAFLLKKKDSLCDVILIEKDKECGGILNSFKYSSNDGIFDYGIHTIYETDIKELDKILNDFLPKDEWLQFSGVKRDYGGSYINGNLQNNSAYVDVRTSRSKDIKTYQQNFLENLNQNNEMETSNAKDILEKKYGKIITKDIFEPIISKLYPFSLEHTHPFITQLLPFSRIVMFDDSDMNKYGKLPSFNSHIAYPNQLKMPSHLISNKSAWYPKKYGMYRFIKAITDDLQKKDVLIKNNCQVKHIENLNGLSEVTINENGNDLKIDGIHEIFWTSGITSAFFALNKNNKNKINFDKPVKTAFVNLGLNSCPNVKDLFYVYCLEKGFISHRLSCPSSFCPESYNDGIYRLTIEVVLKNEMNVNSIKDKVISELETMRVLDKENVKFIHVEQIPGGYPTISLKNVSAIEHMKSEILSQYPNNFKFLGLMSKPNLFFQTDILKDVFQEVN
jgi:protoporphyrinogen oxidase